MRAARVLAVIAVMGLLVSGPAMADERRVQTDVPPSAAGQLDPNNYTLKDLARIQGAQTDPFGSRMKDAGTYPAKAGVVPAFFVNPFNPGLPRLGPDLYIGTVKITDNDDGTKTAKFKGNRADGAPAKGEGTFSADWAGFALGRLIVGLSLEQGCIVRIHVEELLSGQVNGVGHVASPPGRGASVVSQNFRFIAKFGEGGELISQKVVPAPRVWGDFPPHQ